MHHAYIYEGPMSLHQQLVADACEQFGFVNPPIGGNPDVVVRMWEKFGIDDSRALIDLAMLKSTSGRALFVLAIAQITSEAQQALLKLFEEPSEGTMFVLLVPHGTLLPTVRSRFLEYPQQGSTLLASARSNLAEAKEFLASTYAKRSAWVTEFLKDEENVRERAREFLNEVEATLYGRMQVEQGPTLLEVREALADIAHFREYLSDRAPSLKMILEHFAATLPTLK